MGEEKEIRSLKTKFSVESLENFSGILTTNMKFALSIKALIYPTILASRYYSNLLFFFFFWSCHAACEILVP